MLPLVTSFRAEVPAAVYGNLAGWLPLDGMPARAWTEAMVGAEALMPP